jgi:CheY-like chemotaxis protein
VNRTILHVEDDADDVLLFQHACQKAGLACNLQAVRDGVEAIAYLSGSDQFSDRQRHPLPELVLLDLKLPRVNGFEVLGWMRKEDRFRRLPVVVFSSSNHEADVNRAYDVGANSFLLKPVDFNALVELARTVHQYWLALNERPAA